MGTVMGALATGGPVGGLVKSAGAKLATSGAPISQKQEISQGLAGTEKGQKAANVAKLAVQAQPVAVLKRSEKDPTLDKARSMAQRLLWRL